MLHATRSALSADETTRGVAQAVRGSGSRDDPFLIEHFPFRDRRNTLFSEQRVLNRYSGCDAPQDESGPEYVYRIELESPQSLRFLVFDRGDVDIDLHLLDDSLTESGCLDRAHQSMTARVPAGVSYLSLDTFVSSSGEEMAGEYLLVILPTEDLSGS
jgi:hypothetical protein